MLVQRREEYIQKKDFPLNEVWQLHFLYTKEQTNSQFTHDFTIKLLSSFEFFKTIT